MERKRKKTNPRRIPARREDFDKAAVSATNAASGDTWALFYSVLWDKHGFDLDSLARLWERVSKVSREIDEGSRDASRMMWELERKCGVSFPSGPFERRGAGWTEAEIRRAKRWAKRMAESAAWVIYLTALCEEEAPDGDTLRQICEEVFYLAGSVREGFVTVEDLRGTLLEEAKIQLV